METAGNTGWSTNEWSFLWLVLTSFKLTKLFSTDPDAETDTDADLLEQFEPPILEEGTMYLLKGRNVERSYALFAHQLKENSRGLLITRKSPLRIKHDYNLREIPALWLSQKEEENVLYPTQLHKLVYTISETVFNQKDCVILLDGIEYLVVHNRFEQVLKQLYIIHEVLSRHGGILLIPLDPEAFSEKELGFLEKESVLI